MAHRQLNNPLAIAARAHARGRLLDVGCGEKPYAPLCRDLVDEHVGVDHPDSIHPFGAVDALATAYDIPLEDASFDTVLMTEVLEHLEEPARAIAEMRRLVRPGGKLILSTRGSIRSPSRRSAASGPRWRRSRATRWRRTASARCGSRSAAGRVLSMTEAVTQATGRVLES
jgi:SAM-dependent methyltransferase